MFSDPEKNIGQFHVDPGMSVADFGAGSGFYAFALAKAVGESGRIYTIDVQKDLLEKLKNDAKVQGLSNIETIWGDLDEPKGSMLREKSIDRVVIANTLFQLEDKDETIQEAKRILKSNGKLLLVEWSDSFGGLGPKKEDIIKPDVARTLIESHGFDFVKEISAGEHHYGFVFKLR